MLDNSYFKILTLFVIILVFVTLDLFLSKKIFNLYNDRNEVLGIQSLVKLNKKDLIFEENEGLKYFYEPKPDSISEWNPEWLGFTVKNKINADSLNDRLNYETNKPDSTYRILTIGDSFTYGLYVKTEDNYSKTLEG